MRPSAGIWCLVCAIVGGLPPAIAHAQSTQGQPAPVAASGGPRWLASINLDTYFLPDEDDYLQPTILVDRGRLHLEARYNYEDLRTGSVFAGVNIEAGGDVVFSLTPMLGVSFGRTAAAVPAFRGGVTFWRIEASAEGEWALALNGDDDSFFYTWLEADFSLTDWLWVGLSSQTTKVFRETQETEWGPVAGVSVGPVDLAAYVFNLADSRPSVIVSVTLRLGPA